MSEIKMTSYGCDHSGCTNNETVTGYGHPDGWKDCGRYFCRKIYCSDHLVAFCPEDAPNTEPCGRCGKQVHEDDQAMCRQECVDILCSDCFGDGTPEEEYCTQCNEAIYPDGVTE